MLVLVSISLINPQIYIKIIVNRKTKLGTSYTKHDCIQEEVRSNLKEKDLSISTYDLHTQHSTHPLLYDAAVGECQGITMSLNVHVANFRGSQNIACYVQTVLLRQSGTFISKGLGFNTERSNLATAS